MHVREGKSNQNGGCGNCLNLISDRMYYHFCWSHRPALVQCERGLHKGDQMWSPVSSVWRPFKVDFCGCKSILTCWLMKDTYTSLGFSGGSVVKNLPAKAGDTGFIPGLGRSPGDGNGSPLQYSCLENPINRGAWRATVHGVTKSRTQLSTCTCIYLQSLVQGKNI